MNLTHVISHVAEPSFDFSRLSLTRNLISGDISYDRAELDGLLSARGTSAMQLDTLFGGRWLPELLEALYLHHRAGGREGEPLMDDVLSSEDALQTQERLGCHMRG
jgi:hypothetical protein